MKYLKDKQYYIDLYDKFTVEHCRRLIGSSTRIANEEIKENPKTNPKLIMKRNLAIAEVPLFFETGDRYLEKERTIQKWIESDRQKDEIISAEAPLIFCIECNKPMELFITDIESNLENDSNRAYYLYRCNNCKEKRGIYSDGEPYVFKANFCPECKSEWDSTTKKTKNKLTVKHKCKKCGQIESHSYDLNKKPKPEEIDPNFEKDKEKFCISEKDGEYYRNWMSIVKNFMEKEKDEKLHKKELEKAKSTKILAIADLSTLLSKQLAKSNYIGLTISNPEIGRDLIISFTVQDSQGGRMEYDSSRELKKLLGSVLEETNWHLMSDGIRYKLGILSGRLRGQDSTEHIYEDLKNEKD